MIKGKCFSITLTYYEISIVEDYLSEYRQGLESVTSGASYSASAYGVSISFKSEQEADQLWDFVTEAIAVEAIAAEEEYDEST